MRLEVFRPMWGYAAWPGAPFATVDDALPAVVAAGYDGIETAISFMPDPAGLARRVADAGLGLVNMAILFGETVEEQVANLRRELQLIADLPHRFVNCHGGRDAWSEDDAVRFFDLALHEAETAGVTVSFETHRGRPTYNPWSTDRLAGRFPELLLTCDLSHWVVVCERLLDDQADLLRRIARHAHHIHARVGFDNGPQVGDPRAPEHADALAAHERWWDIIWDAQAERGLEVSTLSPEWGPPSYMPTVPHTGEPVADLAAIVDWMAERQRGRFAARG
jgi:sugar phosphate isomerase/epimerase